MSSRARGQAALSFVLLLGSIVAFVGVTLALLAFTFINAQASIQASNRAVAAAFSGTADALLRLARNGAFSSTGYTVTVGAGSDAAAVTVSQNTPAAGQAEIISTARVRGFVRTLRTVVQASSTAGAIDIASSAFIL